MNPILQLEEGRGVMKKGRGTVIRKVTFEEREEGEAIMRQIELSSSDITWMTMRYGFTRGPSEKRDVRRLVFDDFGGGDLGHVVDSLPEGEVSFAIYNYGKGQQREHEKERLARQAEARKWSGVLQGSKQASSRVLKSLFRDWLNNMEVGLAAKESARLRDLAKQLKLVVCEEKNSDYPMEQLQVLCNENAVLEELFLEALDLDLVIVLETESQEGHPSEPLFQARVKVAHELENMLEAKKARDESEKAKGSARRKRDSIFTSRAKVASTRRGSLTGGSGSPVLSASVMPTPSGDSVEHFEAGSSGGGEGGHPGCADNLEAVSDRGEDSGDPEKMGFHVRAVPPGQADEVKKKNLELVVKVGDDVYIDDEEAFQRQVEEDARTMGFRMEKATTLLQKYARGWLVRRERKARGNVKGWSLPQLAAAKLKTILVIAWIPKSAPQEFTHAALFHIRYVVDLLGKSSAVREATVPHVVIKASSKGQLQGPSVAQFIAESYNIMGGVGQSYQQLEDDNDDDDEQYDKPMFDQYNEYISVVRRYNYLMQDKASQLLKERRSEVKREKGKDGVERVSGEGRDHLNASQEEFYFAKHHYVDRDVWEGLQARMHYTGHKRALHSSTSKTGGQARGADLGTQDEGPGLGKEKSPGGMNQFRGIEFKHDPWWSLTFPAKLRGTKKGGVKISAEHASGLPAKIPSSGLAKSPQVSRLNFFRNDQEGGNGLSTRAVKEVFSEKCRDIGVAVQVEQESLFVTRASKMFTFDRHLQAQAMSIRDAGITSGACDVLMDALFAEGIALCSLDFSCNAIGDKGATRLARSLNKMPNLTCLDARSTSIGPRGQAVLFDSVGANTTLTSIDLGCLGETGRNVTGVEGSVAVSNMLKINTVLSSLSLSSNRLSPENAQEISFGLNFNVSLRHLDLSENDVRDTGAMGVFSSEAAKFLKSLSLAHNNVEGRGVRCVVTLLETPGVLLESLNLSGNTMTAEGANQLGNRICGINTSLTSLALDDSRLRAEGGKGLSQALISHVDVVKDSFGRTIDSTLFYPKSLVRLKLSRNDLGDQGATHVASMISQNSTLVMLDLSHNSITDVGAAAIGGALSLNFSIENLSLSYNNIADKGMSRLASSLERNDSLLHLNIEGNQFGNEGSRSLLRVLPTVTCLTDLRIDINDVQYDQYQIITSIVAKHRKQYGSGAKMRLQTEIDKLEKIAANADSLATKLASEKRLLYRATMDIDEMKLRRLEDRAEKSEMLQKANAIKNIINSRVGTAEEGLVEADAALQAAKQERAEGLRHLDWRREQGIIQRDRLRRTLTSLLRTISDDTEEDKRWTRQLTEETLAIVENAIEVKREWRQWILHLTSFLGENADVPGMHMSRHFLRAQEHIDHAIVREADEGLILKDHELKELLDNLQKSDRKSKMLDFQKIGKRFGKLNLNLHSALEEAREHAESPVLDADELAAEEAKATTANAGRKYKHGAAGQRTSMVSLESDSDDDDMISVSASRYATLDDNASRLSGAEDVDVMDVDGVNSSFFSLEVRKRGRRKSRFRRLSSSLVSDVSHLLPAPIMIDVELQESAASAQSPSSQNRPKISKVLLKSRKAMKSRPAITSSMDFTSNKPSSAQKSREDFARAASNDSDGGHSMPALASIKKHEGKGKHSPDKNRNAEVKATSRMHEDTIGNALGADFAAKALDNLQGIMKAHQRLVEKNREERVRLMEVIRTQMEAKRADSTANAEANSYCADGNDSVRSNNSLTRSKRVHNRRKSTISIGDGELSSGSPLAPVRTR